MGFAGHSNGKMTRRTLPHPKPVPKTRTPKYGESLGRCNRPNTTSKGRHWLRCVLSGTGPAGGCCCCKRSRRKYSVVDARLAGGTVVAVVARPAGVERVLVVTDQEELK
jgi:hypothetical protein